MTDLKTLIAAVSCCAFVWLSSPCLGQQSYAFQNTAAGLDAPVFDSQGNRLFGTDYVAVLYGGPSPEQMELARYGINSTMSPQPFTAMRQGMTGYFGPRYVELHNVPCAGVLPWLQVRAWDARLGGSYEEVVSLGMGGYGESLLFRTYGGQPVGCLGAPTSAAILHGLESFSISAVIPEPSPMLLLLLGLPTLLLFRRPSK